MSDKTNTIDLLEDQRDLLMQAKEALRLQNGRSVKEVVKEVALQTRGCFSDPCAHGSRHQKTP